MLLTPGEFDRLPPAVQAEIQQTQRFPLFDTKDRHFQNKYGAYRNGDLQSDPRTYEVVGHGYWPPPLIQNQNGVSYVESNPRPSTHPPLP